MYYYFSKSTDYTFDVAVKKSVEILKQHGFGVLTEIDVKQTLKDKLNVDFPKYKILGACNPKFAYEALQTEAHIGTMLPCNIIVREKNDGQIEIAAIDPAATMNVVDNPNLLKIASTVRDQLRTIVQEI